VDSLDLRRDIRACTRCPLHAQSSGPVPPTIPTTPRVLHILIIGEAPGRTEDRQLRPFVGPAGQLARTWLRDANIDPDSVAWSNTVQCWPKRTPATPSEEEIRACAVNVSATIAHTAPSYVLMFGAVALSQFAPGKRIGEFRGQWFQGGDWWGMATYHPAAIMRNRGLEKFARGDVEEFAFYSLGVFEPVAGEVVEKKTKRKRYWQQERLM
jgi:uracil-DNA glycosylase